MSSGCFRLLRLLVKAVLNELLIPGFGISGAAFATMMSFAAVAGLNFSAEKKRLD